MRAVSILDESEEWKIELRRADLGNVLILP